MITLCVLKTVPQGIPKNHVTMENCKVGMRVERGRDFGQIWMRENGSTLVHDTFGQDEFDDYNYGIPSHGYIKFCGYADDSTNGKAEVDWDNGKDFDFFRMWCYIGGEVNGIKRYDLHIVSDNGK